MILLLISCQGIVRLAGMKKDIESSSGSDEAGVDGSAEKVLARVVDPAREEGDSPGAVGTFAAVSELEAMALALSPGQRKAIELLTSGHTVVEAATAAGVGRATLYRWLKGDAQFVAAYNAWQADAIATARARLLAMTDLAVATVGKAMSRGDAKTAVAVLKAMGVMKRPNVGPVEVEEVKRVQDLEERKRALERAREKARVEEMEAFPIIG
jgi:hypothetical protein